jgi:hypothetical protein
VLLGASTTTDSRQAADSEGEGKNMTTDTLPTNITELEDTATTVWLSDALAAARQRAKQGPTAEAVDRIRARIFDAATDASGAEENKDHGLIAA